MNTTKLRFNNGISCRVNADDVLQRFLIKNVRKEGDSVFFDTIIGEFSLNNISEDVFNHLKEAEENQTFVSIK